MEKAYYRSLLFTILIFFLSALSIISKRLSAETNSPALFTEIIEANTKIKSVEADITQYISTPEHSKEVFKGKYTADNNGRFKITYNSPSRQVVINNGSNILWYYPDDNIVYTVKQDQNPKRESGINPLKEFKNKKSENDYKINYLGKHLYGFFISAYHFKINDINNKLLFDIWVNAKSKVLLAKITTNSSGIEIIKELYGDYEKINDIHFPKRIDVYARSRSGVTKNTTKYSNIKLNFSIPDTMFKIKLPQDVKRKYLN